MKTAWSIDLSWIRSVTIPACDRQTDRQMDGRI